MKRIRCSQGDARNLNRHSVDFKILLPLVMLYSVSTNHRKYWNSSGILSCWIVGKRILKWDRHLSFCAPPSGDYKSLIRLEFLWQMLLVLQVLLSIYLVNQCPGLWSCEWWTNGKVIFCAQEHEPREIGIQNWKFWGTSFLVTNQCRNFWWSWVVSYCGHVPQQWKGLGKSLLTSFPFTSDLKFRRCSLLQNYVNVQDCLETHQSKISL